MRSRLVRFVVGVGVLAGVGLFFSGAIRWPWGLVPPPGSEGAAFGSSLEDPSLSALKEAAVFWRGCTGPPRRVVDVVVLVPDEATFFEALKTWDEAQYFPILIDRPELVLPFVRAFGPARVLRFPRVADRLEAADRWKAATEAVSLSWTFLARPGETARAPRFAEPTAPGVVVSRPESALLAGGAALAAGRFEPFLRWELEGTPERVLSQAQARAAAGELAGEIAGRVPEYGGLGDGCDFVTLAGDWPYRYQVDEEPGRGIYALDDLLGRELAGGRRWGYVGRLLGDASQGVYQAMCSLFLQPRSAVLFNTYDKTGIDWNSYRTALAEARLRDVLPVRARNRGGEPGREGWLEFFGARNPDGLVMVNTSGGARQFNLPGGASGTTDDVPLTDPAVVAFIHSYSAADPYDPETLAGRWVANGAFAYYGSVNEPFLLAFRTPALVADLFSRGLPLAAVLRRVAGETFSQPWRLMLVGDPLYRWQAPGERLPRIEWQVLEGWPGVDGAAEEGRIDALYGRALGEAAKAGSAPFPLEFWREVERRERRALDATGKERLDAMMADQFSRQGRWAELLAYLDRIPKLERELRHVRWRSTAAIRK